MIVSYKFLRCCLVLLSLVLALHLTNNVAGQKAPPILTPAQRNRKVDRSVRPSSFKIVSESQLARTRLRVNRGALKIIALPGARVTLQLSQRAKARKQDPNPQSQGITLFSRIEIESGSGILALTELKPSRYTVVIEHGDYLPSHHDVDVLPGRVTTLNTTHTLEYKYGSLVLIGAPPEAEFLVDGATPEPDHVVRDNDGRIVINRLPIGRHTLRVTAPQYEEWDGEGFEINSQQSTFVSVSMTRATITLRVKSQPGARVFVDDNLVGTIQKDGTLIIPGLLATQYLIRVSHEGFQPAEETVRLSSDERQAELAVILNREPLATSSKDNAAPRTLRPDFTGIDGCVSHYTILHFISPNTGDAVR